MTEQVDLKHWKLFFYGVIAFVIELFALHLFTWGYLPFFFILAIHMAILCGIAIIAYNRLKEERT